MNLALRKKTEEPLAHNTRNVCIGLISALFLQVTERPLTKYLFKIKTGILPLFKLSSLLERVFAVLLLDYTFYLWHRLNHRNRFLWRFHSVHHTDQDLTLSTGMRFHVGELFFSLFWRSAQILILGIRPGTLKLWQTLTLLEIFFHHANLRLPLRLEKILHLFIVTPRMHGIHHSIKMDETNSNYSSLLSIWDRLHGTLHSKLSDPELIIGCPHGMKRSLSLREFYLLPVKNLNGTQGSQNQSGILHPSPS